MNVLDVFTTVRWNQRKYGYKGNSVQIDRDTMLYGYAEKLNDTNEQNRW